MTTVVTQNQQALSEKKSHQRHLDHLIDMQEGNPFTMVPRQLSDAWFDGRVTDVQFKLIFCLMSHSSNFQIKRAYLERHFSKASLAKYLGKMEADGWIRRERIPMPSGGYEVVYHTNRLSLWRFPEPCHVDDRSRVDGRSVDPLNKTDFNETNPPPSEECETKVSPPEERGSLEGEDREAKKTEEEKAAETFHKLLAEHDVNVKMKDLTIAFEQGCKNKGCRPSDVLSESKDAIVYIVSRMEDKKPIWHFRNWIKFVFEWPKGLRPSDGPKLQPKPQSQPRQQRSAYETISEIQFGLEPEPTPEELALKREAILRMKAAKHKNAG